MPETRNPEQFPNASRIMDHFLGGSENFAVDRAAAEGIVKVLPGAPIGARSNRRFLARAVRTATRRGIKQFLDLGSGIPAADAPHEVAPEAKVVYVDNDPVVRDIALRILGGSASGRTAYVDADFRDVEAVLSAPATKELLDFSQPMAVLLSAVLHFVGDAGDPYGIIERYKAPLAPGSLVILTHTSYDYVSAPVQVATDELYGRFRVELAPRSRAEITRFVDTEGWTVLEPGVVSTNEWGSPEEPPSDADHQTNRQDAAGFAAVAVKH
ncbi:SAM-dependent methyltransferase [Dactylosporangium sp. CA-139066]|uniref:SAM-dependent methyltransferase n=1 Tax=Dactylosporangium sp. CA-139066 TaxID=3239930 RepID=UPI003D9253A2